MPTTLIRSALLAGLAAALMISGCGGGGGGGGISRGGLRYTTDWSHMNSGGATGLSQVVRVLRGSTVITSQTVNQDVPGKETITLGGITPGEIVVHVDLFSSRNAGGVVTGSADIDLPSGGSAVETSVGDQVASVKVTPDPGVVTADQTRQFYASAAAADGRVTFAPSTGAYSWTALGSVASVDPNSGLVTGLTPGSGSLRATYAASGATGSAGVTVQAFNVQKGKWTIMVFLNSANDLVDFAKLNVNQMEQVAQDGSGVRFVLEWKEYLDSFYSPDPIFTGTRRVLVKHDTTDDIVSLAPGTYQDLGSGVDMGSAKTVTDFIAWTKAHYPADHYALVMWNHGNGWQRGIHAMAPRYRGISYDFETGNNIQTWEMAQAIGATHLDILSFDACLMQMSEIVTEVKDAVDYVACSEENTPGVGYPYDKVFAPFFANPDDTARNLSKGFVDGMMQTPFINSEAITQSVLDMSKMSGVETAVDNLAGVMIANRSSLTTEIPAVRAAARDFGEKSASQYYFDLFDIAKRIHDGTSVQAVADAASNVMTAVTAAVVWEGHNTLSSTSHGLAIDFSPAANFTNYALDYGQLRFAQETRWDDWLTVDP